MKFMIAWKIPPGSHKAAAESFISSGAPVPAGLTMLGRWHAPGSMYGWLLLESSDNVTLAQHAAEWANYLELSITPVISDEEAAAGLSRVYAL